MRPWIIIAVTFSWLSLYDLACAVFAFEDISASAAFFIASLFWLRFEACLASRNNGASQ